MDYITDNRTGKEFVEAEFDALTAGVCSFCKSPIGDLDEVEDIIVREKNVSFVCTTCTSDVFACA